MTRIYVSGPMTGIPEHNFPAFRDAAARLTDLGFDVIDPSRHGADEDGMTWEDYLRRDLADVLTVDELALLPGWERSKGATLEVHVARALSMPCHLLEHYLDRDPDAPKPCVCAHSAAGHDRFGACTLCTCLDFASDDTAVAQAVGVLVPEQRNGDA